MAHDRARRRRRPVPGQRATDAEPNEITAIPPLLGRLARTGAPVTVEAMGCRREIAAGP